MITAFLKGKLSSEQENMEDLLTSSVFDAFRYSGSSVELLQFLKEAQPFSAGNPLCEDFDDWCINFADYQFWPWWTDLPGVDNCEPDLVVRIHKNQGSDLLVCIEAKFHSSKSSLPSSEGNISDQLAKQWMHLYHIATIEHCEPWLIYLTAEIMLPRDELRQSLGELERKLHPADDVMQPRLSWLSWRQLSEIFKNSSVGTLREICSLAGYLGLTYYHGIGNFEQLPDFHYRFKEGIKRFQWGLEHQSVSKWVFTK